MAWTTPDDNVIWCDRCHYPSHHHSHDNWHPMLMKVITLLRPLINYLGKHFVLCVCVHVLFIKLQQLDFSRSCLFFQVFTDYLWLLCVTDYTMGQQRSLVWPIFIVVILRCCRCHWVLHWHNHNGNAVAGCHPQQSVPPLLHRCNASNHQGTVYWKVSSLVSFSCLLRCPSAKWHSCSSSLPMSPQPSHCDAICCFQK